MEPFIGQVILFAGNFAPRGWAFCDGQLLPVASNSALFSILGTTYGGDGKTTFGLPDLRGRAPIHAGTGPGLSHRSLGSKGGAEQVTLTTNEMPQHTHTFTPANDLQVDVTIQATAQAADNTSPENALLASEQAQAFNRSTDRLVPMGSVMAQASASGGNGTNSKTGGSGAHNNMQPFLTLNYIIALVGLYPSRS